MMHAEFCAACGQRRARRIEVRDTLRLIADAVADFDRRVFRTLWGMLARPGPTVRTYLMGDRKGLVHPMRYLFTTVTVYAAVITAVMEFQPFGMTVEMDERWARSSRIVIPLLGYIAWLFLLPPAWVQARLFRRSGYGVGEHYTALLYVYGTVAALLVVMTISTLWSATGVRVVAALYFAWALTDVMRERTVLGVIKAELVCLVYFASSVAVVVLGFLIYGLIIGH